MPNVALGRDCREWLVQGLKYVVQTVSPAEATEVEAVIKLIKVADLVSLVIPEDVSAKDMMDVG